MKLDLHKKNKASYNVGVAAFTHAHTQNILNYIQYFVKQINKF